MNRMILLAAAFAVGLTTAAGAESDVRQITVTGEGEVTAVPDMAVITLGVTHQATEAQAAMAATSAAVTRILGRLGAMGIDPVDLQTTRFSLTPIWSNRTGSATEAPKITGFAASNGVVVRVRELAELGGILDAVIADGANDFNRLQFSVQEPDPLLDQARREAVADGIAKAELLAKAAGVTLGPVQSISEYGGGRPVAMASDMNMAREASVPVAAGEVSVSASVSMVFAIVD